MYARTMNSLFPLILGCIVYYVQLVSFPNQSLSMYLISTIPAGWSMLNRYKRPKTDTDIIIREIRALHTDGLFDLVFFSIRKSFKLALAFTIGWLMVPFLVCEVVSEIVSSIRAKKALKLTKHL